MNERTIPASDAAWDERALGADEQFVAVADERLTALADEAAGTQLVSIRMHKAMIDDLKAIAAHQGGMGYQTLMKQVLQRFIDAEQRLMWNEFVALKLKEQAAQGAEQSTTKAKPRERRAKKAA